MVGVWGSQQYHWTLSKVALVGQVPLVGKHWPKQRLLKRYVARKEVGMEEQFLLLEEPLGLARQAHTWRWWGQYVGTHVTVTAANDGTDAFGQRYLGPEAVSPRQ